MNHLKITQSELALLCGVSQGTVDRALNGRGEISEATKERILATAKKYGFRASNGNSKIEKTKTIGLVFFDLNNEFFSRLITDIEKKAAEKGFLISVMFTHYNEENEIKCIRQLYSSGVDAILLCSVQQSEQFVTFLKQLSIPVVSLGNKIDGISYVGADDFKAMEYLTAKVKEKHKKIVYYSPALKYENAFAQAERYQGFLNAIKDSPFETVKNPEELKEKYESGTAIISSTDVYAIYAYTHSCADKFYGFDNIPSLDRLKLPISSIEIDTAEIAEKAINIIENEKYTDIFIPHKLIER
jgi:LacI family transcriptional regulator